MKTYEVLIKTTSASPARRTVLELIDKSAASFKTVIGPEKKMGFYPVYMDTVDTSSLYGQIKSVKENGSEVDIDSLIDMIRHAATFQLLSYDDKNMITATMMLDDIVAADVESDSISHELSQIIDEKVAAGIVTREEAEERLAVLNANKVDEALKIKIFKGYRKYNKNCHRPSCIYVDPFLTNKKVGEEGIIAEGLRNATLRMPTICEGEKSVGKNVFMETIAWLLGMPLYMIGFSRNMNPNSIYGEKSTDNSASEELKGLKDGATAKVMLQSGYHFKDDSEKKRAINAAASFDMAAARAASVSIVTDASELYDWMTDGGLMVWNGATCSVTSL